MHHQLKYLFLGIFMVTSLVTVAQHDTIVEKVETRYKEFLEQVQAGEYDKATVSMNDFREALKRLLAADPEEALKTVHTLGDVQGGLWAHRSRDGKLITVSWDDGTGGTMRNFDGLYAYRAGGKWKAEPIQADTICGTGAMVYDIRQVQTQRGKAVYVIFEVAVGSSAVSAHTVRTFSIDNDTLNTVAKYIRTGSGLRHAIRYEMDWSAGVNRNSRLDRETERLQFDNARRTIILPLIESDGKLTERKIRYTFNGRYFRKAG